MACLNEKYFTCKTFNYNRRTKTCHLSKASVNDIGSGKFHPDPVRLVRPYGSRDMTLYERTDLVPECCASIKDGVSKRLAFQKACNTNAFGGESTIVVGLLCKDVWARAVSLKAVAGSIVLAVLAYV